MTAATLLHSSLAGDPDLQDLVEMFVEEMPERAAALETGFGQGAEALGRVAHQIKGAAGSYGFDQLTEPARHLESCCREGAAEEAIRTSLDELLALCRRVTARPAEA